MAVRFTDLSRRDIIRQIKALAEKRVKHEPEHPSEGGVLGEDDVVALSKRREHVSPLAEVAKERSITQRELVELAGDATILDEYSGRKEVQPESIALALSADRPGGEMVNYTHRRVHIELPDWQVDLLSAMCTRRTKRELVMWIMKEHKRRKR